MYSSRKVVPHKGNDYTVFLPSNKLDRINQNHPITKLPGEVLELICEFSANKMSPLIFSCRKVFKTSFGFKIDGYDF